MPPVAQGAYFYCAHKAPYATAVGLYAPPRRIASIPHARKLEVKIFLIADQRLTILDFMLVNKISLVFRSRPSEMLRQFAIARVKIS